MISLVKLYFLLFSVLSTALTLDHSTEQFIKQNGYPCENHEITTKDGYILTYQRIPSYSGVKSNPPVLLTHGLGSLSADFVNLGANLSLAYLLSNQGYDVWLGNSRGVSYSRRHLTLNRVQNPAQFFNFSFHEMGIYDLPDSIDYILNYTQHDSLQLVCFSQGCTQIFVMLDYHPEFNAKVKLASLLGPGVYMDNVYQTFYLAIKYLDVLYLAAQKFGIFEVPFIKIVQKLILNFCGKHDLNSIFCKLFFTICAAGSESTHIPEEFFPIFGLSFPDHISIKQFIHYGQLARNAQFTHFSYGAKENVLRYGSAEPPEYNLARTQIPIAFYWGGNDAIFGPKQRMKLASQVPTVKFRVVDDYNHLDLVWAQTASELLYQDVINFMQNYK